MALPVQLSRLPRSPNWLVGFSDLEKTLVTLRDTFDVRSNRGWLAGGWSEGHRVFVGAELAARRR